MIVFQEYKNNSTTPIEAKYVFPLDDMAAGVCLVKKFFVFVMSTVWNVSLLISAEASYRGGKEGGRWLESSEGGSPGDEGSISSAQYSQCSLFVLPP